MNDQKTNDKAAYADPKLHDDKKKKLEVKPPVTEQDKLEKIRKITEDADTRW